MDLSSEMSSELAKLVQRCAIPVSILSETGMLENSASGALLNLDGKYLCLTCDHVIQAFFESPHSTLQIGHGLVKAENITRFSELDIAVIDVGKCAEAGTIYKPNFFSPARWPIPPIQDDDTLAFCGFPGAWRGKRLDLVEFRAFTYVAAVGHFGRVPAVAPIKEGAVHSLNLIPELQKLDEDCLPGLSGGPVGRWVGTNDKSLILHLEIVGVILRGEINLDLIQFRHLMDIFP